MVPELPTIKIEEPVPVTVLVCGHRGKDSRRPRIILSHCLGEIAVGAAVFFLKRNSERQQLLSGQVGEVLLHRACFLTSEIGNCCEIGPPRDRSN